MSRAQVLLGLLFFGPSLLLLSCGQFLELEPDVRIAGFEPTVAQPVYDQQTQSVVLEPSLISLENYSQVPVTFTRYQVQYYDQGSGEVPAEILALRVDSEFTLYVRGVPTPDPYAPDSTGTRQTRVTTVGEFNVWTVNAYSYSSNMPSDLDELINWSPFQYADDRPIFARLTMWGQSDTEEEVVLTTSAALSTLVKKG